MKNLEIKAGTVEEAINKGLSELNKKREEVEIEILDIGGFLKKAKVVLTVKPTEGEKAAEFVSQLLNKMNLNITAELNETEDKVHLMLAGPDSGKIIGYRGDVLDAVQYITSVIVNRGQESFKKIIVDCENYRLKREETLISLATKLAEKAVFKGRKLSLEPMNPYERRIIHSALQENIQVTTESEGIEPNRYIVIKPKNLKAFDSYEKRPYYDRDKRPSSERNSSSYDRNSSSSDRKNNRNSSDKPNGAYNTKTPNKGSSFGGFGTYLGNTKSGFSSDTSFVKKSGFDNLKD